MVAGLSGETKPLLASKASDREHPPEEQELVIMYDKLTAVKFNNYRKTCTS